MGSKNCSPVDRSGPSLRAAYCGRWVLGRSMGALTAGDVVAEPEVLRLAVAAYLAGSRAPRISKPSRSCGFLTWCAQRQMDPPRAQRAHVELYVRWMQEVRRFQPSTVGRRLSVVYGTSARNTGTASCACTARATRPDHDRVAGIRTEARNFRVHIRQAQGCAPLFLHPRVTRSLLRHTESSSARSTTYWSWHGILRRLAQRL